MTSREFGTGFGRTGTNALKPALEHLGFGRRHHMYEVRVAFGADRPLVDAVAEGRAPPCGSLDVAVPDAPFPIVDRSRAFTDIRVDACKWE